MIEKIGDTETVERDRAASGATGRRFESCQAYQPFVNKQLIAKTRSFETAASTVVTAAHRKPNTL